MGDELLLNFGAKFHCSFTILPWQPSVCLSGKMAAKFFLKCYEWRCQGKKDALENLNSQMSHQEGFYQLFLLKNSGSYELKL